MNNNKGFFSLGDNYRVPLELFQINRDKLRTRLLSKLSSSFNNENNHHNHDNNNNIDNDGMIVILQGGLSPSRYDTDHEPIFRQESYFWWLTGVKEPDCTMILTEQEWILAIPHLPPDYATVMGKIKTRTDLQQEYGADRVIYTHELESTLDTILLSSTTSSSSSSSDQQNEDGENNSFETISTPTTRPRRIYVLKGLNTDSGMVYDMIPPLLEKYPRTIKRYDDEEDEEEEATGGEPLGQDHHRQAVVVDEHTLFPILAECRVTKSPLELALMEHVTQITSFAHTYVMRNIQPDGTMWEYQAESLFRHYTYYNYGSRIQSYTSICGCGPNAAILHYGHAGEPNSRRILPDDNCLFDMGAEYQCYASDITCSFPANGKFSTKYSPIYQAVLDAQIAVYQMAKPGISWMDCHKAAEASILQSLLQIGMIRLGGDDDNDGPRKTIEELVEMRLGAVFMPHGLGHFIGIDTHDVGGYLPDCPPRIQQPGLVKLRTARILEPNMVLTVEPGCYFIDHLLDSALADPLLSKYLCHEVVEEYRGYGGVRLEDVIWIPPTEGESCVNFTLCPRTISEVEYVMAGGKWPPMKDEAPELRRIRLTDTTVSPLGPPPSK